MEMLGLLPVFIKAAECGSFAKAGAILGVSPSSISRQMDRLEADLATKLFRRSTRSLALTPAGMRLMERAKLALADLEGVCDEVRATSHAEPKGKLRVSMLESFGRLRVCPLLPGFLAKYPLVELEVELDNTVANLYREDIDLAVRIGIPLDSRLKARKLIENRMVLCASPSYLAQHGLPDSPDALSERNCLTLKRSGPESWWHFARGKERRKIRVCGNLSSTGGTPLLHAALEGLGIAMLTHWMVGAELDSGRLVSVLDDWRPALSDEGDSQVYAVFLDSEHMKPALRALIDYLAEHLSA